MGKSKPDQVIVHRIDLQPSLKDSLDNAILVGGAARTLQGLGQAIGGIAAGMGTFLAAGFGAYMASWAAGEIKEEVLDPIVENIRSNIADTQVQAHGSIAAFVTSLSWSMSWEEVRSQWQDFLTSDLGRELANTPPLGDANVMNRCFAFLSLFWLGRGPDQVAYYQGTGQWAGQGPKSPAEAWAEFYPVEEAINDGVYETTGGNPVRYTAETVALNFTLPGIAYQAFKEGYRRLFNKPKQDDRGWLF
jgi:hypothetical protein